MTIKEQIIEILNNHAGYIDRSRTEQAVHEDNFNDIANEILSKFCQPAVVGQSEQLKALLRKLLENNMCSHAGDELIEEALKRF